MYILAKHVSSPLLYVCCVEAGIEFFSEMCIRD